MNHTRRELEEAILETLRSNHGRTSPFEIGIMAAHGDHSILTEAYDHPSKHHNLTWLENQGRITIAGNGIHLTEEGTAWLTKTIDNHITYNGVPEALIPEWGMFG